MLTLGIGIGVAIVAGPLAGIGAWLAAELVITVLYIITD